MGVQIPPLPMCKPLACISAHHPWQSSALCRAFHAQQHIMCVALLSLEAFCQDHSFASCADAGLFALTRAAAVHVAL